MSDRTPETGSAPGPPADPAEGPAAISRLLEEIRRDAGWRERVEALRQVAPAPAEPATSPPAAPALDPALRAIVSRLVDAADQAGREPPIEPGRALIGDVWARLRQLIRAEIGSYQARQAVVNGEAVAALQRLVATLDPADPASALGAIWAELLRLDATAGQLERRLARLEGSAATPRLDAVEAAARALASELEPLGALRATVAELEARLARLERAP